MSNYNYVCLVGNLTAEPDLSFTPGGTAVCKLRMAVNEEWTNKEGDKVKSVLYIDVTVWKKQAETTVQFMHKGSSIMVIGKLQLDSWTAKDGSKRNKIKAVARQVLFLGKSNQQKIDEQDEKHAGPENTPGGTPPVEADQAEKSELDKEEDIPY